MENKSKGNENKIILGDFNGTYKIDKDGGNKSQRQIWFQLCPVKSHCGQWARGSIWKVEPRFL